MVEYTSQPDPYNKFRGGEEELSHFLIFPKRSQVRLKPLLSQCRVAG
jgi:hypothetical protein